MYSFVNVMVSINSLSLLRVCFICFMYRSRCIHIASDAERTPNREFIFTVIWDFQTTQKIWNFWLLRYFNRTKSVYIGPIMYIHDELARPYPALTLFEGLFLSLFRRQNIEILPQFGHGLQNCCIKFWTKNLSSFQSHGVSS